MNRQRRTYSTENIVKLLTEAGIQSCHLIPVDVSSSTDKQPNISQSSNLLPLEWFDNIDSDPMTPYEWLQQGYIDGVHKALLGEAFLPERSSHNISMANNIQYKESNTENCRYSWTKVAVNSYDIKSDTWTVTNLATSKPYTIPRIHLLFSAENPLEFVKRIQFAVQLREKFERSLKFDVIVDCIKLTGQPSPSQKNLNTILRLATATIKEYDKHNLHELLMQVSKQYQRVHACLDFRDRLTKNPDDFPLVQIPEKSFNIPRKAIKTIGKKRFEELRTIFKKNTIFYAQQSINAMYSVASECQAIQKQSLFTLSAGRILNLKDFVSTQQYNSNTATKYIKRFWLEYLTGQIVMRLRSLGKGWLDISIYRWDVYKVSKIFRFLRQVKYRMEYALHQFLESSILGYVKHLCDPCELIMASVDQSQCFEWSCPLNVNLFQSKFAPLFSLTISMDASGARYSSDPDEFRQEILKIFDEALRQSCGVRQIDPNVMLFLVFRNDLYLKSAVLVEDLIEMSQEKLKRTYDSAVIPLKAYAEKFEEFVPLYIAEVEDCVREFFATERTPEDVKDAIRNQISMLNDLEVGLPKTIVIGPFMISVDSLKQQLVNKRREVVKKHLEFYTSILITKSKAVTGRFEQIMRTIAEKPSSIENVFAIREFAENVPKSLIELNEEIRRLLLGYDVLDSFRYSLTNESFAQKWEMIAWPRKIIKFLEDLPVKQETEIDDFKKQQIHDQASFVDRLDSLNMEIRKYSQWTDHSNASAYAAEIKKTWKLVDEISVFGRTLQTRQKLLGLSPINLDELHEIIAYIERYRSLWYSCGDFLKYEEIAYGNNLVNVDIVQLKTTFVGIREKLLQSVANFVDLPEIAKVAEYYLDLMDKFQHALDVLDCIKSTDWTIIQWQDLIKRAELNMKYATSINFRYCVTKGILNHIDLIKDIWRSAKDIAERQTEIKADIALDKQVKADREVEKKNARRGRTDI